MLQEGVEIWADLGRLQKKSCDIVGFLGFLIGIAEGFCEIFQM